jgi:ribosome biogenesis protein ERB1
MGHMDGEHEHEGDDSSWSDGVWSEDDDEVGEILFMPLP